ncbi:c-type cytochrome [Novosphingobium sp. ZW T3_23]|uniref:c-type cytochrome n=1 Tax=Novosphingobium sp. ZW T3_23 TaxID=3378084 RepID=UPI0038536F5C
MTTARLIIAPPLLLLAACGGSGQDNSETPADAGKTTPAASPDSSTEAARLAKAPPGFATCRSCHSVEPGKNGIGPSLFGIVGTRAGDVPGFNFSPALKASGVTWDRQSLDTWLQGPMKMVPGTKMVIGVPNPQRRKDVIDYLETLK